MPNCFLRVQDIAPGIYVIITKPILVLRDHNWFKVTKGLLKLNGDLMLVPLVSIQYLTLKY